MSDTTLAATPQRDYAEISGRLILGLSAIVLLVLPQILSEFWTDRITGWFPLALAALGLNLLTGYNGQISVGHGALYGVGAYTTAFAVNAGVPFLVAIVLSAAVAFVVGILIGLPALRIQGLYLALVTLAVAMIFPQIVDQFSDQTGGSSGLAVTSERLVRGAMRDRPIRFEAPGWTGLANDQWVYYCFLAVSVVCFVLVRNIVKSRAGRSIVAVRDNETAAAVSGVNVSAVKVFTFGVSAALAGVGGALLALYNASVFSGTFVVTISIYFLVAVVIGGPASVMGPAIGAITYGVFNDVITPELPESAKGATPLILGVLLVILMLVAPGGVVGLAKRTGARLNAAMAARSAPKSS